MPDSPLNGIDFALQPEPAIAQMANAAHPDLGRILGFADGRFSTDGSEFAFGVREQTPRQLVRDLLHRAFGGSVRTLVLQALAEKKSPEELVAMEKLLDHFEGGKK